jgi:hypothetical protein
MAASEINVLDFGFPVPGLCKRRIELGLNRSETVRGGGDERLLDAISSAFGVDVGPTPGAFVEDLEGVVPLVGLSLAVVSERHGRR